MKINDIKDFKESGFFKIFDEKFNYGNITFQECIDIIQEESKINQRRIEGKKYIVPYTVEINNIVYEVLGIQYLRMGARDGDELGGLKLENYITVSKLDVSEKELEAAGKILGFETIGAYKKHLEQINSEYIRIRNLILDKKSNDETFLSEKNVEKEVLDKLKLNDGVSIKTERWDTDTSKIRISKITW